MSGRGHVREDLDEAPFGLAADLLKTFGDHIQTQQQAASAWARKRLAELEGYSMMRYFREEGLVFERGTSDKPQTLGFERAAAVASRILSLPEDEIKGVELRPTTEQNMSWFVHAWGRFADCAGAEQRVSSEELLRVWTEVTD